METSYCRIFRSACRLAGRKEGWWTFLGPCHIQASGNCHLLILWSFQVHHAIGQDFKVVNNPRAAIEWVSELHLFYFAQEGLMNWGQACQVSIYNDLQLLKVMAQNFWISLVRSEGQFCHAYFHFQANFPFLDYKWW